MVELVAELTTNHMGNLNVLLAMVDAAKESGASCVKMQKKDVETFYSQEKLDVQFESPYGSTYREYRKMFEFGADDWRRFRRHCKLLGLPWFSTVQDLPSLDFLIENIGGKRYKVSSSLARNMPFLRSVANNLSGIAADEIVLSVAGSTLKEIEASLDVFRDFQRVWLLHCVAQYPCPVEDLRLGNIPELCKQFRTDRVRIGYSGHEEGWQPSVAAVHLGAEMVERHFCLSRHSFVHHIECSLTPLEFAAMRRAIETSKDTNLPLSAYSVQFGMSNEERLFLENQTYACDRLGLVSRM
jgi:sialic acid synthase SpsE